MTSRDVYYLHVMLLLLPLGVRGLITGDMSVADTGPSRADLRVAKHLRRQPTPPQFQDSNLRYMPSRNLVICGCGKCGTSSMYEYIYEKEFGQPWPFRDEPYIHEVQSDRWNKSFTVIRDPTIQGSVMENAMSFAIIRDPKERLISAWKSKIACGGLYHTDVETREWMTKELLKLAGRSDDNDDCLNLDNFLRVLNRVHMKNMAYLLDRHFLPQHSNCFYRFPPYEWKSVVAIEDPKAFASIAKHFGSDDVRPPASHTSTSKVLVSQEAFDLLENVTELEYKVFGEYLDRPSYVKPGVWV